MTGQEGIRTAELHDRRLRLRFDPARTSEAEVAASVRNLSDELARTYTHVSFDLGGLDCEDCASSIVAAVRRVRGVRAARAHFITARLDAELDAREAAPRDVIAAVHELGYHAHLRDDGPERDDRPAGFVRRFLTFRDAYPLMSAFVLLAIGWPLAVAQAPGWTWRLVLALAIVVGGHEIARRGLRGLVRARRLDIKFLMTVAVVGAVAIDQWVEATLVVVLFTLGETLEGRSLDRARGSIRALMQTAPTQARVLHGDHEHLRPTDQVERGDRLAVRPGERIAADGRITTGTTSVNESAVTGESVPAPKGPGDLVFAGSVNEAGYVEMVAERAGTDTTITRIIHMVEEAQAQRAPVQRFVDGFAAVYTPTVVGGAVLLALLPPLLFQQSFTEWLLRALVLLVIACPCALVISTPVAIASALAAAGRHGVLIKGGAYLEALGKLRAIAFDKTGTLTRGVPVVQTLRAYGGATELEVLEVAAALEKRSEHALAAAVRHAAAARGVSDDLLEPSNLSFVPGRGIRGELDGVQVAIGTVAFVSAQGVDVRIAAADLEELDATEQTPILVARAHRMLGLIGTADELRAHAPLLLQELKDMGGDRRVLLTGDREATAAAIATRLALTDVRAELLPEGKVSQVRSIGERHGPVAMVGDGINDAPALAAADVGIAMGVAGTDAALETADVALMRDDLSRIPAVIDLGRRTLRTVRANIALSLATKVVFFGLAVVGLSTLWMAVLADVGASLAVTLYSLRLLRHDWRRHDGGADDPEASAAWPAVSP